MSKEAANTQPQQPADAAGAAPLVVVMVEAATLNPAPYNPRRMTEKQVADLRASIEQFGLVDPLVVNNAPGRENVVVGGHMRLRVAQMLGHTQVPVVYVTLDEERERELNLRLNKNTGEWDWDVLANEYELPVLSRVGFTADELREHLGIVATTDLPDMQPGRPEYESISLHLCSEDAEAFRSAVAMLVAAGEIPSDGAGNEAGRAAAILARRYSEGH